MKQLLRKLTTRRRVKQALIESLENEQLYLTMLYEVKLADGKDLHREYRDRQSKISALLQNLL